MRPNDFDGIAKWYDRLAKLMFGDALIKSQLLFLNELPEEGNLLIIGGGTGWILKEVVTLRPQLKIDYVEASTKMIALSKAKNESSTEVQFIIGTEADIPETIYDAIITNFFLDVFKEGRLKAIMHHLKGKLSKDGVWLCTDFKKTGKWQQRFLLKLMHLFFGLVSNLDANELIDFEIEFIKLSLSCSKKQISYNGMILSAVYRLT
jgi:ubiquinone/menaquinone biosynthesis C-methylase UbiE